MSQCKVAAQKRARRNGSLASKHSVTSRVLTFAPWLREHGRAVRIETICAAGNGHSRDHRKFPDSTGCGSCMRGPAFSLCRCAVGFGRKGAEMRVLGDAQGRGRSRRSCVVRLVVAIGLIAAMSRRDRSAVGRGARVVDHSECEPARPSEWFCLGGVVRVGDELLRGRRHVHRVVHRAVERLDVVDRSEPASGRAGWRRSRRRLVSVGEQLLRGRQYVLGHAHRALERVELVDRPEPEPDRIDRGRARRRVVARPRRIARRSGSRPRTRSRRTPRSRPWWSIGTVPNGRRW